jgi:hypothetical protein
LVDASATGASLLANWELPPAIVKAIELQDWSAYTPPSRLPQEHAAALSVLHLAHVCSDLLNGQENVPEPAFIGEHLASLGFSHLSVRQLYGDQVYPGVLKEQKALPEPIRKILCVRNADTNGKQSAL